MTDLRGVLKYQLALVNYMYNPKNDFQKKRSLTYVIHMQVRIDLTGIYLLHRCRIRTSRKKR